MSVLRVEIPISFQYTNTDSGELLPIPAATTITVTDRNTHAPASVYENESGGSPMSELQTDAGGNINGWVVQGSYTIAAAPKVDATPPYLGASVSWEAVRGDGVENYAPGTVDTAAIAPGAITWATLATAIAQGLVPVGSIFDFGGNTPPDGWVFCDGTLYPTIGVYDELFATIGYTYGGSAGNFKVPDLQGATTVGAGTGPSLTTRALGARLGAESHTHPVPGVDHLHGVPGVDHYHFNSNGWLTVGTHAHTLSDAGGAKFTMQFLDGTHIDLAWGGGGPAGWSALRYATKIPIFSWLDTSRLGLTSVNSAGLTGYTDPVTLPITGHTDAADRSLNTTTNSADRSLSTTASATTDNNLQPSVVVNKVIKYSSLGATLPGPD